MQLSEVKDRLTIADDERNIYLDFRSFGNGQSEALEVFLHEAVEIARLRGIAVGFAKNMVLVFDRSVLITEKASVCLRELRAADESVAIELPAA